MLHEYRQLYSQHKNRIHLHRYLLLNMLKQDLILQTMSTKDHYPGKKIKKSDQKDPSRGVLSCKATLLKLHFGMYVFSLTCCIFSENLFLRTSIEGCFGWINKK